MRNTSYGLPCTRFYKKGNLDRIYLKTRNNGIVSDGSHTFNELYDHRSALFLSLLRFRKLEAWRSMKHPDGTMYENMFIAGLTMPDGRQISYHLEMKWWDKCEFLRTLATSPEFDGHTSEDVLNRLIELL